MDSKSKKSTNFLSLDDDPLTNLIYWMALVFTAAFYLAGSPFDF